MLCELPACVRNATACPKFARLTCADADSDCLVSTMLRAGKESSHLFAYRVTVHNTRNNKRTVQLVLAVLALINSIVFLAGGVAEDYDVLKSVLAGSKLTTRVTPAGATTVPSTGAPKLSGTRSTRPTARASTRSSR